MMHKKLENWVKCFTCNKDIYRYPSHKKTRNYCNSSCRSKDVIKGHGFKKTGKSAVNNPYKRICFNGKRVYEHRYLMELHLGRKLTTKEHVHHINGNQQDNKLENLSLMNSKEHGKITHDECLKPFI